LPEEGPLSPLQEAKPGDVLSTVARARTLTVLGKLSDEERKGSVVLFLYEAGLISKDPPVLSLNGANLRGISLGRFPFLEVNLSEADLSEANLSSVILAGANLQWSILRAADLSRANLSGADLDGAILERATLRGANLTYANLSGANLSGADLRGINMAEVKGITNESLRAQTHLLEGAMMPNGQQYED
jgi:uncharacterized protein YjbI with pentapeptide repeats